MSKFLSLTLLLALAAGAGRATSLAALIAGRQTIQAGGLQFSGFSVSPQNGIATSAIDVAGFTDAGGNAGLRFTSTAVAIGAGGSNQLIADVRFQASVTNPASPIDSVTQSFDATLSAGLITAFDFTSVGPSIASDCVSGDVAGCLQVRTPTNTIILPSRLASTLVERQIQITRATGSSATGTVGSWDVTFSQAPAPPPTQTAVTVTTAPPGLKVTVDGATFLAPQTFNWTAGSSHTIAAVSPQGTGGTRHSFANWSDAGALSHLVTAPAAATTFTASFTTQFLLTAAASPAAGGSAAATPLSPDGYYAAGTIVQLTAKASPNFQFANWSGDLAGAANPQPLTMSSPHTVTASFSPVAGITVATNPPGLNVTVDGATFLAPQTFNWTAGSSHTIAAVSPQGTGGTRHSFANWSDQGAQAHTVNAPSGAATYTASFATDYLLTAAVSPAASGSLTAVPPSPDGYYSAGTSVQLTATAAAGYRFNGWAAGLSGAANPQVVALTTPRSITASFQATSPVAVTSPAVAAVTPAAFFKPVAVSPGLIATVFGDRMGPQQFALGAPGADGKFPAALAGTRVLFDDVPGALIYTSQQQVSVVVPYGVDGQSSTLMVVEYNGQRSDPYRLDVAAAAPAIFAADASGSGPGAILNAHDDGTVALNTALAPAPRSSYISVYMTGEGQTNPGGVDGLIALAVLPKPVLKVTATIGGVPATVIYAGAAPGLIAGVMQVNLLVPPDTPAGPAVPLAIQVGGTESQAGITVAIGN